MNINESGCQPYGMALALMVIGVSAWYPDTTHRWGSLHRFQIFKQNWNISILSSVIEFLLIWGVPWVGVGWVGLNGSLGMMWGWQWHGDDGDNGEDTTITINMLAAICNFFTCLCLCVHTCVGTPPPPSTHPQSCREPKSPKFSKSWTNWDNSILFEDSLPLNTPELI